MVNRSDSLSRRRFVGRASIATVGLVGGWPRRSVAQPPPETTRIRLPEAPAICFAPQYLAEELLVSEGFSEVIYVPVLTGPAAIAAGKVDIGTWDLPNAMPLLDNGDPILLLAGIHSGCWDLYGNDRVRAIRDLKGKTVAVYALQGGDRILLSSMLAYVGINPRTDVKWVAGPAITDGMRLFVEGKADAYMAFEPQQQELRARRIGHLIVNTAKDRPWSQHFCCMLLGNKEFVRSHPVATKRAMRAILKAADLCAQEPERAARLVGEKGFSQYESALQALKDIPFAVWRTYDPEATLRFHALRLQEAGIIRSSPQKLIAQNTDWRFLKELKSELKA
jgi:NitT/TauT family transport system substrate-binding protein